MSNKLVTGNKNKKKEVVNYDRTEWKENRWLNGYFNSAFYSISCFKAHWSYLLVLVVGNCSLMDTHNICGNTYNYNLYCKKDYKKKKIRENGVFRKEVNNITDRPKGRFSFMFPLLKNLTMQRPYFVKLTNQFAGRRFSALKRWSPVPYLIKRKNYIKRGWQNSLLMV